MNGLRVFSLFLRPIFRLTWRWTALGATVVVAERIALLLAALETTRGPRAWLIAGPVLSALYLLRMGTRAIARVRIERVLYDECVSSALSDGGLGISDGTLETVFFSSIEDAASVLAILPELAGEAFALIVVAGYVAHVAPWETLLAVLLSTAAVLGLLAGVRGVAVRASDRYWQEYQHVIARFQEVIHGRLELVAAGASDIQRERAKVAIEALHAVGRRRWLIDMAMGRATTLVVVAAMFVAALVYGENRWPLVDIFVLGSALPPLAGLSSGLTQLVRTRGAIQSLASTVALRRTHCGTIEPGDTTISFDAVTVTMAGRVALDNVSFTSEPLRLTVIVGPNGAGKSTLLKAILGIHTASTGTLSIGDVEMSEVDVIAWRKRARYVPQRPYLPPTDVRTAMSLLVPPCDYLRARRALEHMDAWSVLHRKVADDPLGARVDELSAGERQRVAIARVLVRDADVYLLDEPDANLDRAGIERLGEILKELATRATVIVAAHTSEIVALADHVIELDRGRVVRDERRTHDAAVSATSHEDTPA